MVNLKQIQLVGFKSFADKTVINMSDGITCIVGPNGCGKSNVADAIRWVLGEQSAKTMRGSSMADVIFSGTEKRRRLSFCEVTLVFDNTGRIFDVNADEVEMTRRLYRDGESEYLLNRQPSRMKVLTGLFHGAGLAKEGYSIIGQGRIAQIMNSKPEDRRLIFEEATGIVVFKDRKAEAERRLAASKDNLRIFQSGMDEVERQLGPLAKASENARKYKEAYASLRHHEMNAYIYRTESAESERAKINADIERLTKRKDEISARSDDLLRQHGDIRSLMDAADERLRGLNEKRLEYSVGAERTSGESRVFGEKANAVKEKLNAARDEITAATAQISSIDAQIKREEERVAENGDRMEALKGTAETLRAELDEIGKKIAEREFSTGEHRRKVLDTMRDLSELKLNMGSISAQRELLEERVAEMRGDMERIAADRDAAREEYDASVRRQEELSGLVGSEDRLTEEALKKMRDASEKLDRFVQQTYDTEARLGSLKSSLDTYVSIRDNLAGYAYSVRGLMNAAKTDKAVSAKISGLIADVVSCPAEYETAIETAFGGAMQNVITRTRDDARDLIEYLKRNRIGQVTFLPVEALRPRYESDQIRLAAKEQGAVGFAIDLVKFDPAYENVIHYLLGNTLICDDIASATRIAAMFPRAFKLVTLDGDVIAGSGSMTGGSRRENSGNLLSNERKIKELEEEIEKRESFLSRADGRRAELTAARDEAERELSDLRNRLGDAKVELSSVTERQTQLMKTVSSLQSEHDGYGRSVEELEARLSELGTRYTDVDADAGRLNEQSESATAEMDAQSREYDRLITERDEKAEKLNGCNVEMASLSSAIKAGEDNVERLNSDRDGFLRRISSLETTLPDLNREFENFTEQAARATLSKEEQAALDDIVNQIAETEATKAALNERSQNVDRERLENYDESESVNRKLNDRERALQHIDDELENLRQRIEEEYGETYESCLSEREEGYDMGTSAANIANLRRQITLLGAVNMNAMEEYEELSARHEEMLAEREDLTKAIDDLTLALKEICDEMLRIFNDGFEKINQNFQHTFRELFGGGRAELQLDYTDCDDPLNAGVEIVACPPGKKLSKISLLSGGEQSLTAIAILFAIIQMRPMPFCLLDEIEAALDDSNVGRYANYLKKFSKETQFIVITHRKPTMEAADTLFGVTMEEKGVSKIVSVKLSEVEERLGGDTVQ